MNDTMFLSRRFRRLLHQTVYDKMSIKKVVRRRRQTKGFANKMAFWKPYTVCLKVEGLKSVAVQTRGQKRAECGDFRNVSLDTASRCHWCNSNSTQHRHRLHNCSSIGVKKVRSRHCVKMMQLANA